MKGECPNFSTDIDQFIWALFLIDSVVERTLQSAGYTEFSVHETQSMFGRKRRYHSYRICDQNCFVNFHWKKNKIDDINVSC